MSSNLTVFNRHESFFQMSKTPDPFPGEDPSPGKPEPIPGQDPIPERPEPNPGEDPNPGIPPPVFKSIPFQEYWRPL